MRHDVQEVLGRLGIAVERQGALHWASCPSRAHGDSTASWRIILDPTNPRYGQHRCYGCGFGGYAVQLVEEVLSLDRDAAREWLAEHGVAGPIPTEVELISTDVTPRGEFRLPRGVVTSDDQDPTAWPLPVRRYCAQRGLGVDQVRKWRLGYALEGKQSGRLVFPVRDQAGKLISYTGRSFRGAALRYKDARLRDGADLAAIFGAEFWPPDPGDKPIAIVEGAINGLAIERVAPELELGALFGSQLLDLHLLRLSRFRRGILATDPDGAGNRVASQLVERLARYIDFVRVELPPKLDCADLRPDDLRTRLDDALARLARPRSA